MVNPANMSWTPDFVELTLPDGTIASSWSGPQAQTKTNAFGVPQ
jgi:hypothetical protein